MNIPMRTFSFVVLSLLVFLGYIYQPVFAQLKMPSVNNSEVETMVRELFADVPDMIAIAKCESGFRQYGSNGSALRGGNGFYIGVFQISEDVHAANARALGFDIYELSGNLGYARYLYDKRGTVPWVSCLKNPAAAPTVAIIPAPSTPAVNEVTVSTPLTSNLQMGMAGPQVVTLQQLLNAAGFTIAASGPGSPGNETTQFGKLTRDAVMRLQCSRNLICSGNESTTGYGRFGPLTRALLLQITKPATP